MTERRKRLLARRIYVLSLKSAYPSCVHCRVLDRCTYRSSRPQLCDPGRWQSSRSLLFNLMKLISHIRWWRHEHSIRPQCTACIGPPRCSITSRWTADNRNNGSLGRPLTLMTRRSRIWNSDHLRATCTTNLWALSRDHTIQITRWRRLSKHWSFPPAK